MNVYKAINAVQAELAKSGISKDRTNEHDRYQFRGIDDVYNALAPLLAKHGLCILPRILKRESVERQSQKGTALFYVTVEAEFDFVCAGDGSKHTVRTFGEAMDRGDKGTNKAMSAAYKYAAFQAFAIPTEADNDADAQSHEVVPHKSALSYFNPQAQKLIRSVAQTAIQAFNEGNEWTAYEEVTSLLDKMAADGPEVREDAKLALYEIFKPHSALRAALKRMAHEERQKEAA